MTWKGRKKYKKCIIKKKKTYIILSKGIMPLPMLFLFGGFLKTENQEILQMLYLKISASIFM